MAKDDILDKLLRGLLAEGWADLRTAIPIGAASKRHLLRTLMNIRPPLPARPELMELQDRLLSEERASVGVTNPCELPTIGDVFGDADVPYRNQLILWKGDITTLAVDVIVNAANSKLLGCFVPHHRCIDNAIHSAAGIRLRLECHEIMEKQGHDEPAGQAKITHGYHLPAQYVLHTVGPIIYDSVTEGVCESLVLREAAPPGTGNWVQHSFDHSVAVRAACSKAPVRHVGSSEPG